MIPSQVSIASLRTLLAKDCFFISLMSPPAAKAFWSPVSIMQPTESSSCKMESHQLPARKDNIVE